MGEGYMVAVNFISPSTQPLQLQLNSYTVACTGRQALTCRLHVKPLVHQIRKPFCTSD